jgi:hypothetical protein
MRFLKVWHNENILLKMSKKFIRLGWIGKEVNSPEVIIKNPA